MLVHGRGVIGSDVKAFEPHEGAAYCAGDPMGVHGLSVNAERPDATLAEAAAIVDETEILWLPALSFSAPFHRYMSIMTIGFCFTPSTSSGSTMLFENVNQAFPIVPITALQSDSFI